MHRHVHRDRPDAPGHGSFPTWGVRAHPGDARAAGGQRAPNPCCATWLVPRSATATHWALDLHTRYVVLTFIILYFYLYLPVFTCIYLYLPVFTMYLPRIYRFYVKCRKLLRRVRSCGRPRAKLQQKIASNQVINRVATFGVQQWALLLT